MAVKLPLWAAGCLMLLVWPLCWVHNIVTAVWEFQRYAWRRTFGQVAYYTRNEWRYIKRCFTE